MAKYGKSRVFGIAELAEKEVKTFWVREGKLWSLRGH
jgi:hypothetical protein